MLKKLGGIIGWVGTVLVFGAVAIRFLKPDWDRYAYWGAWAGLVCVLIYTLSQWRDIVGAFRRRQTRLGTLTLVSILIVLGILVAINYLGTRQGKRWDLTTSSEFTLSDQTVNVLKKLDAPLKIRVFEKSSAMQKFKDRLLEYESTSKQVAIDYFDPDREPTVTRQNQVQNYGTVVFEYKGRTERVVGDTEQDFTNGIIKVVSGSLKKVYFLQGHGEHDPGSAERSGYAVVKGALERENYSVERLPLIQRGAVPADATVVVVAGPTADLLAPEVAALTAYLDAGGKLFLLVDPPATTAAAPLPNVEGLARAWGAQLEKDVIVDASGIGQLIGRSYETPVVLTYPPHPITDRFDMLTAYPLTRSISILTGTPGRTPQSFVETSQRSWAETDIDSVGSPAGPKLDPAKGDRQGPLSVAVAVAVPVKAASQPAPADAKPAETRVVVMGDSDFVANFSVNVSGNRDFFMNILGWLSQQENLISIRPKAPGESRLTLTADQSRRIAWLALLIIPGAIIAFGVSTWWRRR
ncbi:MAG: Gldg family protein [Acidobacteria bacterium]|nr:Gldg family protein [Acidobacteriota bacterium]